MTRLVCGLLMLLVPVALLLAADFHRLPSRSDERRLERASTTPPKDQTAQKNKPKAAATPSAVAQTPVALLTLFVATTAMLEELAESLREPEANQPAARH